MDITHHERQDAFPALGRRVTELMSRAREALFSLDASLALRLIAECSTLSVAAKKEEASCNSCLLVGISAPEERFSLMQEAHRCSRLGRIVHQIRHIVQNVSEISKHVSPDDVGAFKPLFLLAEVELKDAILSILHEDEHLAHSVRKKDEELDTLYAEEIKRIFHSASDAMFYDFHTGISLLFILRAIERIGDHAKQMALPPFFLLNPANAQKKSENNAPICYA